MGAWPLAVGKHLSLAPGVRIQVPLRIPMEWKPLVVVGGEIKGEIPDKQDNACFKIEGGNVYARLRPRGTLMMIR